MGFSRNALFIVAAVLAAGPVFVACGSAGEGQGAADRAVEDTFDASQSADLESVRAVAFECTGFLTEGDFDAYLELTCREIREDMTAEDAEFFSELYTGVRLVEFEDLVVDGDTATAQVRYDRPGDSDYPSDEVTELTLVREDSEWRLC